MEHADHRRLGQAGVECSLHIFLGLCGHGSSQPQLAGHAAIIKHDMVALGIENLAHRIRDRLVDKGTDVLYFAVLRKAEGSGK